MRLRVEKAMRHLNKLTPRGEKYLRVLLLHEDIPLYPPGLYGSDWEAHRRDLVDARLHQIRGMEYLTFPGELVDSEEPEGPRRPPSVLMPINSSKVQYLWSNGWVSSKKYHTKTGTPAPYGVVRSEMHIAVDVNWAGAFEGAEEYDSGSVMLPADTTSFEMIVSGIRMVLVVDATTGDGTLSQADVTCYTYMHDSAPWYVNLRYGVSDDWGVVEDTYLGFAVKQLRAVCIALEAGIVKPVKVEAPPSLNKLRVKAGKVPLLDYHVVRLARKARGHSSGESTGRHGVRLHFRRGHWWPADPNDHRRHWRKWTLVGDPDLGWVEKHYRA